MLVMHKSVTLKCALEGRGTRTEKVPSVHQLAVYLVLDKGHQNARENEPATNLQNKHQRSLDFLSGIPEMERSPSRCIRNVGSSASRFGVVGVFVARQAAIDGLAEEIW